MSTTGKRDQAGRYAPADLTGQQIGRFYVIGASSKRGSGRRRYWLCRCECGKEATVETFKLRSGYTKSCGCVRSDPGINLRGEKYVPVRPHSMPEYQSWSSMKDRCENPTRPNYRYYGGRGITVCEEWSSYQQFLEDMGPRPPGTSIDRINVNGPYSPENCRWADQTAQNVNRRRPARPRSQGRLNPDSVREIRTLHAEGMTFRDLGGRFGVTYTTISAAVSRKTWAQVA